MSFNIACSYFQLVATIHASVSSEGECQSKSHACWLCFSLPQQPRTNNACAPFILEHSIADLDKFPIQDSLEVLTDNICFLSQKKCGGLKHLLDMAFIIISTIVVTIFCYSQQPCVMVPRRKDLHESVLVG